MKNPPKIWKSFHHGNKNPLDIQSKSPKEFFHFLNFHFHPLKHWRSFLKIFIEKNFHLNFFFNFYQQKKSNWVIFCEGNLMKMEKLKFNPKRKLFTFSSPFLPQQQQYFVILRILVLCMTGSEAHSHFSYFLWMIT